MKKEDPFRGDPEDIQYKTKWQVLWEWFVDKVPKRESVLSFVGEHVGYYLTGLLMLGLCVLCAGVIIGAIWGGYWLGGAMVEFYLPGAWNWDWVIPTVYWIFWGLVGLAVVFVPWFTGKIE